MKWDNMTIIWSEFVRPLWSIFSHEENSYSINTKNDPIFYIEGNCEIILTAPHGGKNKYSTEKDKIFNC